MKNILFLVFINVVLLVNAQAPSNDEIFGDIPLCYNTRVSGTTLLSTKGTDENVFCISTAPTSAGVWYSFKGNGKSIDLNTCVGTSYNSSIFLYTGTSGFLSCVAQNDDDCGNKSRIFFPSVLNENYLLLVSGNSLETGNFELEITTDLDSLEIQVCETYTATSGTTYTASTTFFDTLQNISGCDSVTFIDLTINQNISSTLSIISTPNCSGKNKDTIMASSTSPLVNSYNWYDAPTGGNLLFQGNMFAPTINASTTYYVQPDASTPAPMPPITNETDAPGTGGYWFTAPNSFIITSLFVPHYLGANSQNISVIRMDNNMTPPTAALTTNDFSTLYLTQANPSTGSISVNIPIYEGEIIGIFGSRGSSNNSYSNTNNYTIINGDTAQLTRLGFSGELITTTPNNISDFGFSSNIELIEFDYINTNICIPTTRSSIFVEVYKKYLDSLIIETCNSYTSPIGNLYTGSSIFYDTLSTINGCDSILFVDLTLEYTSTDTLNIIACDSFISPAGKIFTANASFIDTLYTSVGCHQYKHIDLTIGNATLDSIVVVACDTYTSPNGTPRIQSAMFYDTLSSTLGCDSTVFVDLTINYSFLSNFSLAVCDSFITAQGVVYDTSSVFYDTLTTYKGCDSVLYTTLTVHQKTVSNISVAICNSYLSPNGTTYTNSALFSDTLTSINGCDSIFNIDLIINNMQTTNLNITECNSYISPLGNTYTNSTNIQDTLATIHGCDSIVNINLTINYATLDSIYPAVCGTYTSPSGNVFTSTSLFNETYTTVQGCDSIVSIFLTVHGEDVINITPYSCGDYTSPAGNVYTSSAVFTEVLTSTFGCDSTYNIDLTIPPVSTGSVFPIVCNQYVSPLGFNKSDSEIFTETLVATNGCDSILTINLTINKTKYDTVSIVTCGEYISPSGQQYLASGIFEEAFTSAALCDSFYVLDISISPLSLTINKVNGLLTSLDLGATYQWYDCNANKILNGETNRNFQALENGSFKVIIEKGSCMDTSACVSINSITAINDLALNNVKVYPNPTKGNFNIIIENLTEELPFECYNAIGRKVTTGFITNNKTSINLEGYENGIYFINISGKTFKVIKTN